MSSPRLRTRSGLCSVTMNGPISAPLQRGADAAHSHRAAGRWRPFVRIGAPGIPSRLGEGSENVLDKPSFRNAMRRRRCLIPADGFYEWNAGAPKRPSLFRAAQIRRGDHLRRPVGDLDRTERRRGRHGRDRHDTGKPRSLPYTTACWSSSHRTHSTFGSTARRSKKPKDQLSLF